MKNKYGYVITITPGLIENEKHVLSFESIEAGSVIYADGEKPAAIFETEKQAKTEMLKLAGGSTPETYAGLGIESAYVAAAAYLIDEESRRGFEKFEVPILR